MSKKTIIAAINEALALALERDERVVILGEDVGKNGGVFRATEGLIDRFGGDRVIDTPLAESMIVGTSVGLAANGMIPLPELQFMGFMYPAFDQLVSHAARIRMRSQGRYTAQMVVRAPYGGGIRAPELHCESPEALFVHTPGLKVVVPSNPYDAKGLLLASVEDPDPVIFFEPMKIYRAFREEVPDEYYTVPLGRAHVAKEGRDCSVFAWGVMVRVALAAAKTLEEKHGVDVEVVDLRTLSPLDREAIRATVSRTGRAVVAHEAPRTGGLGAEIVATINDVALDALLAPVGRVTAYDAPYPLFALEDEYLPDENRVVDGVLSVMRYDIGALS